MDVIVERPAALDVHNASVMACVRTPGAEVGREHNVEEYLHDQARASGAARLAPGARRGLTLSLVEAARLS